MKRSVVVFIVAYLAFAAIAGVGMALMPESMKQFAGLAALPVLFGPFIMAYVCHRMEGSAGSPFKGLVWGPTAWYWLIWFLGILIGLVTVVIAIGLGLMGIDPEMTDFIASAEKMSGQEIPPQAIPMTTAIYKITAVVSLTIGPFLGAAFACLSTFPLYGWLGRRLLVLGRAKAVWILFGLVFVAGLSGGFAPNPALEEVPIVLKCLLTTAASACSLFAGIWIFLRSRSAVLPALASTSFTGALGAVSFFSADANPVLAPPGGALVALMALLVGIALWVNKDPGGEQLAVAGVAYDGTPLTPAQLEAMHAQGEGAATNEGALPTEDGELPAAEDDSQTSAAP